MRRHATQPEPEHAPVSMRTVILDIHLDGSMAVTIDGTPYLPPDDAAPWSRASFPQIIDHASEERTVPVRVEVHEVDGTSFTELLPARPPRPAPASEPTPKRKKQVPPALVEVTGEGFVPGEDVACCLIVSHTDATPHGAARAVLDPKQVKGAGEVMLVGRISGTVVTRSLS
ncbi:hypothetical protein ACTXJK_18365 [Brachybacterium tyrofermentans]|uniref:hypothetical protein n=1 Tax=Brachybacterium tyrofermentans TaxID=47848 RepID=UPI003FD0B744